VGSDSSITGFTSDRSSRTRAYRAGSVARVCRRLAIRFRVVSFPAMIRNMVWVHTAASLSS
jgi:hypothetical protein